MFRLQKCILQSIEGANTQRKNPRKQEEDKAASRMDGITKIAVNRKIALLLLLLL